MLRTREAPAGSETNVGTVLGRYLLIRRVQLWGSIHDLSTVTAGQRGDGVENAR